MYYMKNKQIYFFFHGRQTIGGEYYYVIFYKIPKRLTKHYKNDYKLAFLVSNIILFCQISELNKYIL